MDKVWFMFCKLLVTHGNYFLSRHKNISGIFSLITMTKDSTIHIMTQREAKQDKSDKINCAWMGAGNLSVYFVGPRPCSKDGEDRRESFHHDTSAGDGPKAKSPCHHHHPLHHHHHHHHHDTSAGDSPPKKVPAIIIIISPPSSWYISPPAKSPHQLSWPYSPFYMRSST